MTSPQRLLGEFPALGVGMNEANWLRCDKVGMREKTPPRRGHCAQAIPKKPHGLFGAESGQITG